MGEPERSIETKHLPELKRNYPVFRLMGSNLVSFFGDQIYLIAIPLIVLAITGSPLSMGIVAALERLPVLFQPIAGVLADRLNRRGVLLACDIARAILVGVLGILYLQDSLMIWELYIGAFIIGLITQLYNTSQFATIPQLVRKENLQIINSINSGFLNTAVFIAPGVGGLLISFYNPGYALMINSFSFLVAFLAIITISIDEPSKKEYNHSFLYEIREGF
ncbi:MFS transporter [Pontibacillus marinus]|uniref:MFS transporter n=1 Tax=Pontibacillus marinus TaxID=273164 RepID=UPI000423E6EA|nr:MFS transporter [Pontibacillus marinus]